LLKKRRQSENYRSRELISAMDEHSLKRKLAQMIAEDVGRGDLTLKYTPQNTVKAEVKAKQECILSGVEEVSLLFEMYGVKYKNLVKDGDSIKKNTILFNITGSSHDILLVERTALNLLSIMSGISTTTSRYVKNAGNVKVAATRKTHPLLRYFEKKAVEAGGGISHRMGLDDMVLIKDNHLTLFKSIGGAVKSAKCDPYHKIEVEAATTEMALEASKAGADVVMLDNMTPAQIVKTIKALEKDGVRENVVIEASGGITLETIREYSKTGVDIISTSALTMAPAIDFSMKFI